MISTRYSTLRLRMLSGSRIEALELAVAIARQIDVSIGGLLAIPLAWVEQELPPLDHPEMAALVGESWTYGKGLEVRGSTSSIPKSGRFTSRLGLTNRSG